MAGQKRQCINCRYFQDAGMAGSGWCTHPKRQEASGVRLLVRRGELACRNSWGGDLFSNKDGGDELRVEPASDPVAAADQHRPAPVDDEVTSVVTPPIRPSVDEETIVGHPGDGSDEDRVVSDRPAPRRDSQREEPDHHNNAARSDQDERARLIARGNSDALAHARERLFDRKRRLRVSDPEQDRNAVDDGEAEAERVRPTTFASPDRNRPSPPQPRYFQRFGKAETLKSEALPGDPPVPRAEVLRRQGDGPSPDRYESVPEVDPSFDLPGWRKSRALSENDMTPAIPTEQQPPEPSHAAPDSKDTSDEIDDTPSGTAFEHTINRARRIRESKRPLRPHTGRVDLQATSPRSDVPTATAEDHAAANVPDMDENDGSNLTVSPETMSDVRNQVPAPVHRERRPGWLEQFGIRRLAGRDEPRTSRHDARGDDDVDQPVARLLTGIDDDPFLDGERNLADESVRPLAAQHHGTLEPRADDTYEDQSSEAWYIPNPPASRDDDAGERASRQSPYILPDLDEVFAERTYATASPSSIHDVHRSSPRFSGTSSRHVSPDLVSGGDEQRDVGRAVENRSLGDVDDHSDSDARHDSFGSGGRWSRESPASPRESWFRARRFREWEQSHGDENLEHRSSAYANGQPGHAHPVADHDGFDRSLPDLDTQGFDLRDVVERGGELLDMTIDIAPDIPRACRSCRSFQSSDGGARGWCTNEWAFAHRRMVNEDDLACDATIGCWWLPDDRYWQSDPPVSWQLATPLIDEFIARRTRSRPRKTSGE